ncbi:MAG: mechanosensitive ion channel family protein [Lysobacterales bacterium]
MQATESSGTDVTTTVLQQELDLSRYIPDSLLPIWNFFTPYPWLLTVLLVAAAYFFGKLLKMIISRSLSRFVAKTSSDADDRLVEYLTSPLVLTMVNLSLMLAVSLYDLPTTLRTATLAILASILLFSWLRAGLRTASVLLQLVASNSHRFEIVQERTIPLFDMTIKLLLVGMAAYFILLIWGINPTAWLASAGVIGIAVGFAAKDSLANLFSGIFIVADAPYKVGDYIVLGTGERGQVTHLGMRSTRLLTRDDIEVTVPNAVIANAKIINESGGPWLKHRIRVPVGVAYGSDVDEVCSLLYEIATDLPEVVKEPAPRVRMRALGNSSLDFELLAWIDHPELRGRVRHNLLMNIYKGLNQKGIEIPFPQTDIHVRSMPDKAELEN